MHWGERGGKKKKIENYLEENCTRIQVLMGIKRFWYSTSRCTVTEITSITFWKPCESHIKTSMLQLIVAQKSHI